MVGNSREINRFNEQKQWNRIDVTTLALCNIPSVFRSMSLQVALNSAFLQKTSVLRVVKEKD